MTINPNNNRHLNPSTAPSILRWIISASIALYALWLLTQQATSMATIILLVIGFGLLSSTLTRQKRWQRQQFIETYVIPPSILHRLRREQAISSQQLPMIERGFKDFCQLQLGAPRTLHHLPSKAVDALWHTLILDTQRYADFCQRAFGKMLHHHPAAEMQHLSQHLQTQALKATWRGACALQNIRPQAAQSLPLLFVLDQHIAWPDGLRYDLDQLHNTLRYADTSGADGDVGLSCSLDLSDCSGSDSSGGDHSDSGSSCGGGCGGD